MYVGQNRGVSIVLRRLDRNPKARFSPFAFGLNATGHQQTPICRFSNAPRRAKWAQAPRVTARPMSNFFVGHNAFEPDDLDFAQSILDEVWASLPCDVRNGADSNIFRERLAGRVLAAIKTAGQDREELKRALLERDIADLVRSDRGA